MSFARPRNRPSTLPTRKPRKRPASSINEITFDFRAREEFLTGFHKRKQARIKYARDKAVQREKEERRSMKHALREQRENELREKMKRAEAEMDDIMDRTHGEDRGMGEGIDDASAEEAIVEPNGLNGEEEIVDEDNYATVTVEEVEVSRDGIARVQEEHEDVEAGSQHQHARTQVSSGENRKPSDPRHTIKKKKRQKFRYESKAERSLTKQKQKLVRKMRAAKRRGQEQR